MAELRRGAAQRAREEIAQLIHLSDVTKLIRAKSRAPAFPLLPRTPVAHANSLRHQNADPGLERCQQPGQLVYDVLQRRVLVL